MEIVTSWKKEGLEEGERNLVLRLLRKQVGRLPGAAVKRIEALPIDRLEELGEALLDFTCRGDLDAWLKSPRS
jgi:hypothetical protein